jgi:hypothetical protein
MNADETRVALVLPSLPKSSIPRRLWVVAHLPLLSWRPDVSHSACGRLDARAIEYAGYLAILVPSPHVFRGPCYYSRRSLCATGVSSETP